VPPSLDETSRLHVKGHGYRTRSGLAVHSRLSFVRCGFRPRKTQPKA
jgi:hypothetical protein